MSKRRKILFTGGRIFLSEKRIIRGGLLVEGERIAGILTDIPDSMDAERIDITDLLLVPGFIDAHTHLFQEGVEMTRPDLSGAGSKTEMFAMLRDAVRGYEKGEPIIASDFDESSWTGGALPLRQELDQITGQHPLVVRRICGHIAVANSMALGNISDEWAGVDRETGIMKEDVPLNISRIFPPDRDKVRSGLKRAVNKANTLGITGVHEITNLSNVALFEELADGGGLTMNVRFYIREDDLGGIRRAEAGFNRTGFGGVKLFADGSIGARTAANTFEYGDSPGNRGMLIHDDDEIRGYVKIAEEEGIQLAIHAIGDLAIKQVLDAYEEFVEPGNPCRHRIEHAELVDEKDLERILRLGIVVSMQPNFIKRWSQPGGMYEKVLGERYPLNNPVGHMKRLGIVIAFGSDTMPMSPILGIEGTISAPFNKQRMGMEEAITCYTRNSALAGFSFSNEGEITGGKEANLVILDPGQLRVCKTFYRGKAVFND